MRAAWANVAAWVFTGERYTLARIDCVVPLDSVCGGTTGPTLFIPIDPTFRSVEMFGRGVWARATLSQRIVVALSVIVAYLHIKARGSPLPPLPDADFR